mmetsp:Transcript_12541/g.30289  ORF Transcript_12541/g.30289 Transcript_12541/m.30289 type:complete len:259 (+) Transcript_12541:170-946(+)
MAREMAAALKPSSAGDATCITATAASHAPSIAMSPAHSGARRISSRSASSCRSRSCDRDHRVTEASPPAATAPELGLAPPVNGARNARRHPANPRAAAMPSSSLASSATSSHARRFISKSCGAVVIANGFMTPSAGGGPISGCTAMAIAVSISPAARSPARDPASSASSLAVMSISLRTSLSAMRCPHRSASATASANAGQNAPMAASGIARADGDASSTFHMSSDTVNTSGERKSSRSSGAKCANTPTSAICCAFSS